MGKKTLSQAKNDIRKCLTEIADSSPPNVRKELIWDFFDSCCAYCGRKIGRQSRKGHMDHLVAIKSYFELGAGLQRMQW